MVVDTERKPARGENTVGLTKNDYRGAPSTLCAGCGHNSIANQIIAACFEMNIVPENVLKFSGIGCSSKSPTYFLNRTFGFNSLHGRMPSVATGALFADTTLKGIAVSGDGDTASIGLGQFKHAVRRNLDMVYIVENNGVYGLTKGQFSATAEEGLHLKYQGTNMYRPIDICLEAMASNATFVARSFAGDASQVKELIKAAISHRGIAILDIISPCVTFNNHDEARHSYGWAKENQSPIHDITYIPLQDEIMLDEEIEPGGYKEVALHDGSTIVLKKVNIDHDPTDRQAAINLIEQSAREDVWVTGLLYINDKQPVMTDLYGMIETPLNRLGEDKLRPSAASLAKINASMFNA